jgi:predicted DNA-binding transcriptional regulator YafY
VVRADRLVATLILLQTKGRITASELAAELEVSEKTARRDLEALAMAGVPVYSQSGRNGGWQLLGGGRTDLSGLTADEARTLFLAAGVVGTAAVPNIDTSSALRKLLRALPESFRADAEAAVSAVMVDPTAWGRGDAPPPPEHLPVLQRALLDRRKVRLGYVDRQQTVSERVIDPLGLVSKGAVWYLVADTERGLRTFRVGRVRSVEVLDQAAERPADFDLATAWQAVVDAVGERRLRERATILIERRWVGALRGQFGSDLMLAEVDGAAERHDGRIAVIVGGPSPLAIAEHLAGWGRLIEVVEPAPVRDALATIGRELVAMYAADA